MRQSEKRVQKLEDRILHGLFFTYMEAHTTLLATVRIDIRFNDMRENWLQELSQCKPADSQNIRAVTNTDSGAVAAPFDWLLSIPFRARSTML